MPLLVGPVAPGFDDTLLSRTDNGSSTAVQVGFSLNFFGQTFSDLYVNTNGNITFGGPSGVSTPQALDGGYAGPPIIAPFFADVDNSGFVGDGITYGADIYEGRTAFGVTWQQVDYFDANDPNHWIAFNTFQVILTDRSDTGAGNFDIYFNYGTINWEAGDADGGVSGLGGVAAVAGYSNATGAAGTFVQLDGSLTPGGLLDTNTQTGLVNATNDGLPGQFVFQVRNGAVVQPVDPGRPETPPQPAHEVTFDLAGTGFAREGDSGATPFAYLITRSGDLTHASSVQWMVSPDASDLAPTQPTSGVVEFAAGQTAALVTVLVQGDRDFEPDEILNFKLSSATHNGVTWDPGVSGASIILNDDLPNTFTLSQPVMQREGVAGPTPFEFVVTRAGDLSQAATVTWQLGHIDTSASDFSPEQAMTGVATFAAGVATASIVIKVAGDSLIEPDEAFALRLTEATVGESAGKLGNVSTTGTILDDDGRSTVLVAGATTLVHAEGDAGATAFDFGVTRVGDLSHDAAVTYAISMPAIGGLSASEILGPLTGVVSFAAGASEATIHVLVAGDTAAEVNEAFLITLGGGAYNTLSLTGVVLNDDGVNGSEPPALVTSTAQGSDSEPSSFLQHLMGGNLWGDGGI